MEMLGNRAIALLPIVLIAACLPLGEPRIAHVDYFRIVPEGSSGSWLASRQLALAPLVSGSVHTPRSLEVMPRQFHDQYPHAAHYRTLWAREREVASFLHGELAGALRRRFATYPGEVGLLPDPTNAELQSAYQSSAQLGSDGYLAVLFPAQARDVDAASDGNDTLAPFRRAFIIERAKTSQQPFTATWRIVTGYMGIHCEHELVGRSNKDKSSTKLDWLAAVVDPSGRVMAQAYVGVNNDQWECPVSGEPWRDLVDALADRFIQAVVVPTGPSTQRDPAWSK